MWFGSLSIFAFCCVSCTTPNDTSFSPEFLELRLGSYNEVLPGRNNNNSPVSLQQRPIQSTSSGIPNIVDWCTISSRGAAILTQMLAWKQMTYNNKTQPLIHGTISNRGAVTLMKCLRPGRCGGIQEKGLSKGIWVLLRRTYRHPHNVYWCFYSNLTI